MPPGIRRSPPERAADRLQTLIGDGWTYGRLAARYGVSTGCVWRMARGIEPRATAARRAFHLPPVVGADTQYTTILHCVIRTCRKPFIPNHPQRRRCFECSPPRRHR
jgi:hypothetical protein